MSTKPPHPETDPIEVEQFARARKWIIIVMLIGLSGFIAAPLFNYDYLFGEFERMGWKLTAAILAAEAVAMFWFLRFLIIHGLLNRPMRTRHVEGNAPRRTMWWLILSLIVSASVDAGISVYEAWHQGQRYARAQRLEGTILELAKTKDTYPPGSEIIHFDIVAEYEFEGVVHKLEVKTTEDPERRASRVEMGKKPVWNYQPGLLETLMEKEPPIPVKMRVNPDRPVESWIELGPIGVPMLELAALSAACAFIQLLTAIGTAAAVAGEFRLRRNDVIPWWVQPASFIVLVFEGFFLLLVAIM